MAMYRARRMPAGGAPIMRSAAARPGGRGPVEWRMPEVSQARHCRHCAGDCRGECMVGGGQCIHGWNGKRPRQFTWRVLLSRRWWHRVLWGEQPWGGR
jgi:hypothetical protein